MPDKFMQEKWYQRFWRPATAIIYLAIVVFDFVVMPIYVERVNEGINYEAIDQVSRLEHAATQVEVVRKLNLGDRTWDPLTLMGGGLFHLAFGAILTGAAVTRGMEKFRFHEDERPQSNRHHYYGPPAPAYYPPPRYTGYPGGQATHDQAGSREEALERERAGT